MSTLCPTEEDYDYGDYLYDQLKEEMAEEKEEIKADMKAQN